MRSMSSIQSRLILFISASIVLIVIIAAISVAGMMAVERRAENLHTKWLAGSLVLGELSETVSEFDHIEALRGVAKDEGSAAEAEAAVEDYKRRVADGIEEYVTLVGADAPMAEITNLRDTWKRYVGEHETWVAGNASLPHPEGAMARGLLHQDSAAEIAVDKVIAANAEMAKMQAVGAEMTAETSMTATLLGSAAATALALLFVFRVRTTITKPLGGITAALSKLAGGDLDTRVPGQDRDDEIGEMTRAFEVFRANAAALEQAHEATRAARAQADALARHDPLTGLSNRRVFAAELQSALSKTQDGRSAYCILLIDLDRFKPVNDILGHSIGDLVLCEISRRLENAVNANDIVARLGGDEFAVIAQISIDARAEGAGRLATRLLGAIREPIMVGTSQIEVGASIGIASCTEDGSDAEVLLRAADLAMYRAKKDGRGVFRFFERSMDEELRDQAALETDFRRALSEGLIMPYYQPLMNLEHGRICGFEVLARWEHPERGFIPPAVFIPLTEQLGLVNELTSCILRQACRDARGWGNEIRLAVNIWPEQLQDPILPTRLLAILSQEDFPPSRLEIEVTESALMGDIETAKSVVAALRQIGITIALDDFGTGYSSLYHLRELKFDKLKIDRSFVQSMRDNPESQKIVDAVLALAKSLGLLAVAEGIEDADVSERLSNSGCEYGQGFFYSQAVPATDAEELLAIDRGTNQNVRRLFAPG